MKFTEAGRVEVRASAEPAGPRVRVRIDVVDTGIGVPADKQAALFEPFTQADSSTTRIYGGTGLGLAISREIVAAMEGQLEYAPNPGGGSVFSASVLLDRPMDIGTVWSGSGDQTLADVARPNVPGDKGTVLVVEDNPVNQLVAVGMLEALGYLSVTVEDGPRPSRRSRRARTTPS